MTKPMGAKRRSVAAHSASHPGMRGPLNLLMGENWLVWHFWNPSQLTYQMAVSELFTNATFADDPDDDPFSLMIGGGPSYSKRENGFDGFRHAPGSMGFVTPRVRWVSSRLMSRPSREQMRLSQNRTRVCTRRRLCSLACFSVRA